MSLVNDMLRDLDRRKAGDQVRRDKSGREVRIAPPILSPRSYAWPVLAVLVAAAIGFLAWFLLGLYGQYQERLTQEVQQQQLATELLQPGSASLPAAAAQGEILVQGFNLHEGQSVTRLELLLSRPLAHRLETSQGSELRLWLSDARLNAPLPAPAGGRLQSINAVQRGSELELILELSESLSAQSYVLQPDHQARLILELYPRAPEVEIAPVATATLVPVQPMPERAPPDTRDPTLSASVLGAEAAANVPADAQIFNRTTRQYSLAELDTQRNQEALRLVRDGRLAQAQALLRDFLRERPEALNSRLTLVTLLLGNADHVAAEPLVLAGLQRHPDHPDLSKAYARILLARGDHGPALELLQGFAGSQDVEMLGLLASLRQSQADHAGALALYNQLLDLQPERGAWLAGKAIALDALGSGAEALRLYRQAAQAADTDARLRQYANERIRALQ